jgi:MFS family permease
MNDLAKRVQRTYLTLMLGNTLAASFIWGINTLFLLDAGLSNFEAFAANAFFTAGMVLFEIPTGVVADTRGRRASYLLGTVTLAASTLLYWALWWQHGPFWMWAVASILIGLGFTFFSGATEAWLVDALHHAEYDGLLETVMGRGQMVAGAAMLVGSVAGGALAQATNLGAPFLVRVVVLGLTFVVAATTMRDLGFVPERGLGPITAVKNVVGASVTYGIKAAPIRWMMFAAPFTAGVGIYAFYALQPYLLEAYGDTEAYTVAGLAAALVAGAQMIGGMLAPRIRSLVQRRTSALFALTLVSCIVLIGLGLITKLGDAQFAIALVLCAVWGLAFAAAMPIRQAYLNDMIPSQQRATVLSFDSLAGNVGGVVIQPGLGRAADAHSYGASLAIGGVIQLLALPMIIGSRLADGSDRADIAVQAEDAPPPVAELGSD